MGGKVVSGGKRWDDGLNQMRRAMNCFVPLDPEWNPICAINGTPKASFQKYRKIQILVDSGAAENVLPPDLLPDYEIQEGEARKNGVKYMTADGNEIPNLGELDVPFRTYEGHKCGIKFQLADVKRPLLSVTALTAKGNRVSFHSTGGTIVSQDGKQKIDFKKQQGVYVLEVYVPPFQGQGA